jgi:D-glycero-D-manno-heptose 1,7-bisphosphate phosphatase
VSSAIATAPSGARRWLILDRDGVINHDRENYIRSPADWQPIDGALDALARLYRAGFGLTVATNQSGIGRGYFDVPTLDAIHAGMCAAITASGGQVAAIAYCPHRPDAGCDCRKPAPGLLLRLMTECGFAPGDALMIGDAERDLEAARAAGVTAIAVGERATELAQAFGVPGFSDLAAAADWLLEDHWPC